MTAREDEPRAPGPASTLSHRSDTEHPWGNVMEPDTTDNDAWDRRHGALDSPYGSDPRR
jgi:hypothetical protein